MKKLFFLLMLFAQCYYLFAVDVTTKRQTTRVCEDKVRFEWRKSMPVKTQNYNLLGDPGYVAQFGLDCYVSGGVKRYAIQLKFQYVQLDFPAIIHVGSVLALRTIDNQVITLKAVLSQSETKYELFPIGHDETSSCAYYPISEEDLQKISKGINMFAFDYMRFDGNQVGYDKISFTGNKLSKELSNFYNKVSKKESKLKERNENVDQSIQNFLNFDPNAVILRYHGYVYPVFLYEKYLNYTEEKSGQDAWNSYLAQVEDVQTVYNSELLNSVSESVQQQTAIYNMQLSAASANLQNAMAKLRANIQQLNAKKAALKQAEKARNEARTQQMLQAQKQSRQRALAKQQQEMARIASGYNGMDDRNRGAQRQMQTSDLAQYKALQMSDAVYGQAATNHALAKQQQYNAQQNQQAQTYQRQINQQQSQQVAQQQQIYGTAENAVTASGAHVQIKVNGNQVTGYSSGNNLMGPEWHVVVPAATVQDTSNPISQASRDVASRFAYQANVRELGMVYWGTPTRRVINDGPSGSPVKAVTQNGQTLTIMVNGNSVVAYGSGLNQASDIQWHGIVPSANIAATNNSLDGDLATRFNYKANIPGIGTVYF